MLFWLSFGGCFFLSVRPLHRLPIPQRAIGWLLGKEHSYLHQLIKESGAEIVLQDSASAEFGTAWRYLNLTGSGRAIDRAKKLIYIRLHRLDQARATSRTNRVASDRKGVECEPEDDDPEATIGGAETDPDDPDGLDSNFKLVKEMQPQQGEFGSPSSDALTKPQLNP
jgi:KH domain